MPSEVANSGRGRRRAVAPANSYAPEGLPELRTRMTLITTVPALDAHSMMRCSEWRQVVADFAAESLRCDAFDFAPQAIGQAARAASTSAFTQWVRDPDKDLLGLIDAGHAMLADGFDRATIRWRLRKVR